MKINFIFLILLIAGCDGRVRIPHDDYVYTTSVNEPGYEKIGVKFPLYQKALDQSEQDQATIDLLRKKISVLQQQIAELKEQVLENK